MSCFYSLFAFYIAKYLYFMENKVSYANISADQDGRAIEKVKNGGRGSGGREGVGNRNNCCISLTHSVFVPCN